jgi:hypothetical protein
MKSSFYSTAAFGVVLLLGATGLGRRAPVAGSENGQNRTATIQTKTQSAALCSKGDACDDPAVLAGNRGQQEANGALRDTICSFLALYGPLGEPANPQRPMKEPRNPKANSKEFAYCALSTEDKAAGLKAPSWGKVDPGVRPKVMIAVLPDPIHTQLALRFDESADELENSIQDLGWIYDRAWLPWDPKEHEDEIDFDKRMENKYGQEGYERIPGAIMFRASLNQEATRPLQPLIVLVVGDTPTGGVTQRSFHKAIEIWKKLTGLDDYFNGNSNASQDASNTGDAAELNILGPTYSGSVPSLKALLKEITSHLGTRETEDGYFCPTDKNFTVTVSSGTISNEEQLWDLSSTPSERYDFFGAPGKSCNSLKVVVTSMAANSDNEWLGTLDFVERHQTLFRKDAKSPIVVARLTEAESTFGGYYVINPPSPPFADFEKILAADKSARESYKSAVANNNVAAAAAAMRQILPYKKRVLYVALKDYYSREVAAYNLVQRINPLHFYFPREISNLRTAYEENKIFGFNSQSNSVQTQLHLSLGGNTHDDDTVHTFSGTEGAAALEAAMSQLAGELDRNKVDVVVLSATDVLDEIFLTRYLAQHAPNTAVIVTDTDGLFLRNGDDTMQNVYVISPWPLLPGNERWSAQKPMPPGWPPVRLHNSAGGQGLYNAVRYLMCVPASHPMDTCGAVPNPHPTTPEDLYLRKVSLREYQTPIATWAAKSNHLVAAPPLWLSVVERGRFWPISLVDLDQVDDGMPGQTEWPGEYRRNLPLLSRIYYQEDGHEIPLKAFETQGISESAPIGIIIAACLIAFLLAAHGLACIRARLDRTYAWAYALADEKHHGLRLRLQIVLALAAVPGLVLLKPPIEAGIVIPDPHVSGFYYIVFNWLLQIVAVLLACWPLAQLTGAAPWPKTRPEKMDASIQFGWRLLMLLVLWFACNRWLWDTLAPSVNKWPSERAFFFYRSAHLFSGSAPVLPVLLLAGAVVAFLLSIFDRLVFYSGRIPKLPDMSAYPDLHCPSPKKVKRMNDLLTGTWDSWRWGLLGTAIMALALLVTGLREVIPRSLTHGRFDMAVIALSGLVTILLMYDLAVAVTAWTFLRNDCLHLLARSPLRWGFTWIKGWSWRRMWAPGGISPDTVLDYLRRLAEANRRAISDPALQQAFEDLRQEIAREPKKPTVKWAAEVTRLMGLLHRTLASSASTKLMDLRTQWQQDFGPISGTDVKDQGLVERGLREERPLDKYSLPADTAEWRATHNRMAKEEFVALLYLGYIRMVLLQIRNRIVTAAAMYVLLLWGLTSYPFLNHHSIVTFLTCVLIGLATAVIWIYAQMHRDEILSRTTETDSGKLDADFFTKILAMVGIPLVTLIASQFPEVSNALFSWLEPGLSAMK